MSATKTTKTRESKAMHESVWAALLAAQAEFPILKKDTKAHNYKYVTYDQIVEKCGPILNRHGIVWVHLLEAEGKGLSTTLHHVASDSQVSCTCPVVPQDEGPKAFGSAMTYAKRYSMGALLGIASEEDDDGEKAGNTKRRSGAPPKVTEKQLGFIGQLFDRAKISNDGRLEWIKRLTKERTSNASEINVEEASSLIEALNAHLEKNE